MRAPRTTIHENLSWKEHMLAPKNKLHATLGAMIRVKLYFNQHFLIPIHVSLVISRIRYCIINRNYGNSAVLNHLQGIQDTTSIVSLLLPFSVHVCR